MRILICDDEVRYINDLQGYIEEYMKNQGIVYDIFTTTSPYEITESDAVYDLVFLDIKMPEFDGLDLAYELKQKGLDLPDGILTIEELIAALHLN